MFRSSPHLVDDYDFPDFDSFFSRQKMRFRSPWFKPSPKKLKKLGIGVVFCWLFFAWFGFLGEIFLKIGLDCFDVSECLVVFFDWRKVWVVG